MRELLREGGVISSQLSRTLSSETGFQRSKGSNAAKTPHQAPQGASQPAGINLLRFGHNPLTDFIILILHSGTTQ